MGGFYTSQGSATLQNNNSDSRLLGYIGITGSGLVSISSSNGIVSVGSGAVLLVDGNKAQDGYDRITTDGMTQSSSLHLGGGANKLVVIDNDTQVNGSLSVAGIITQSGIPVATQNDVNTLKSAINSEVNRAQSAENKISQRVDQVSNVAAASIFNITAQELTPDGMREHGLGLNATIAGRSNGSSEVKLGVSKNLSDGFVAGLGVGAETGRASASLIKSVAITENINLGVGANYDGKNLTLGPNVSIHQNGYGVGASLAGPSILLGGVTVPLANPALGAANVAVAAITGAWNGVTGKTKAEIADLKKQLELAHSDLEEANTKADQALVKAEMAQSRAVHAETMLLEYEGRLIESQALAQNQVHVVAELSESLASLRQVVYQLLAEKEMRTMVKSQAPKSPKPARPKSQ